jgi:hypothetical protein
LGDQDKRAEAHDLLAPVYNRFTERFDTIDLKKAKALLGEAARARTGGEIKRAIPLQCEPSRIVPPVWPASRAIPIYARVVTYRGPP